MSGQSAISVSTVNISGSAVRLTLQSAPPSGQALKVSYSPTGGNPLKDSNGNQAAALTGYSITVPSTPVNITTVEGKGSTITVTFSRSLNESVMPDAADFSVTASNAVKRVSDVRISGSTLTLTVEGTLGTKQSVQLSYTPGAEQLQDEQGNMVAAFAGRAVNMGSAATGGSETSETAEESELTGPAPGGQKPGVVDVILAESAAAQSDETTEQGEAVAVYTVNSSSIADALQQMKGKTAFTIGLTVDGGDSKNVKTLIPAAAFSSVNKGSTVLFRVATQIGEYDFPITVVDTASIANQLKAAPGDVYIGIVIRAAGTGLTDEITSKAKAAGLEMLGSPIVYDTFVEAGGKSYALSSFNQYINRTMYITPETSLKDTTVVWYDPVSKQPVYVPALLDRTDGRTSAVIKHMTNGTYAAVKTNKQFTDMAAHWAKGDVQRLASKLIVSGVSASAFNPNKSISKAEFVTMLTRALGLYGTTDNLPYSDVAQQSWFHSPVATAYAAGLIDRAEQFHPNEPITRSDIAIMIYRAAEVTVGKIPLTNIDQPITGKYTDLRNLASEERNAITANVKIGLMTGSSETEFAPEESATRAQAAVILGRLMKYAGLLN
jgi:hypothetical protein